MSGLLGAIQFLTRVPVRTRTAVDHDKVVPWFPFVGLLIGCVVGGIGAGLSEVVPIPVAAACAVVAGLLITGAFHEDGLADIADAFGGGWTPAQRFEILKDSRHGTYGVAALCGSIVLRVVAVASIVAPSAIFASLVAAHVLGRTSAVGAMLAIRPATQSGLGADTARAMRTPMLFVVVAVGVGLTAVVAGWWVVPFAVAAIVGTGSVGWLSVRKIGGLAGDVLGAVEQVVECLVLVTASGLALHHGVWWT